VRDIATEDQLDEVTDADGAIGDVAPGQPVPLVGSFADGLQIAELDGSITELRAFDGPDSEAFIGVLDVRPGGSRGDFTLAYEHIAEGETSIRFLRVRGDEVTPVGATEVTGNEGQRLTSLTWSPDGRQVASTHEVDGGIEVLSLTEDLEFAGRFRRLSTVPGGAVVDWRWRSLSDDGAEGHFVVQVGGPAGRTQQIAVTRTGDVQTNFPEGDDLEPVPGMAVAVGDSERETIDLVLRTEDGGLSWTWGNIGDAFGDLVVPDRLGTNPGLWSGLRTTAHAGSAVVQHDDGAGAWWLRLVGQRGELVELNNGVSWTPVG
jgi:hypothetical protein